MRQTTEELAAWEQEESSLLNHQMGDEEARRGLRYESALRCIWLLDLRGTTDMLSIAGGEDARVQRAKAGEIFRQVKKNSHEWKQSDEGLRSFVGRALKRWQKDPSVRHEFYTNAPISHKVCTGRGSRKSLKPDSRVVTELGLGTEQAEALAESITFYPYSYPDNELMLVNYLRGKVEDVVEKEVASDAISRITVSETHALADRLIATEAKLSPETGLTLSWKELAEEIGLQEVIKRLERLEAIARGFASFSEIITEPDRYLGGQELESMIALKRQQLIERKDLEESILRAVSEWRGATEGPLDGRSRGLRVLLIVGKHGAGKTCLLNRVGERLSNGTRVGTYYAFGDPPELLEDLYFSGEHPEGVILLVDNLFEEWEILARIPRSFFDEGTMIIAATSLARDAPELRRLNASFGEMLEIFEVPPVPSEAEMMELSVAVGRPLRLPPSRREQMVGTRVSFRAAVRMLEGRDIGGAEADLLALVDADRELQRCLEPILVASFFDVAVPTAIVERVVGRAIPKRLEPWLLYREIRGSVCVQLEDSLMAKTTVEFLWGKSNEIFDIMVTDWAGRLLAVADWDRSSDRLFFRYLWMRISRSSRALAEAIAKTQKYCLESLIERESKWAVAFYWLSAVGESGVPELVNACLKLLPTELNTSADAVIWLQALGAESLAKELRRKINLIDHVPPVLAYRTALMIVRLPLIERRELGRSMCHLLLSGQRPRFLPALLHPKSFDLITSLVAENGNSFHRRRAVTIIESFLAYRVEAGEVVSPNWCESYVALVDRFQKQERHHLALDLEMLLLTQIPPIESLRRSYEVVRRAESRWREGRLPDIVSVILAGEADQASFMDAIEGNGLPSNTLRFIERWGDESAWDETLGTFIAGVENLRRSKLPFGRVSALVLPIFKATARRGNEEARRRVLALAVSWLPGKGKVSTVESSRLLLKILEFAIVQNWMPDHVKRAALRLLGSMAIGDSFQISDAEDVLGLISREVGWEEEERNAQCGLLREWREDPSVRTEFLGKIKLVAWFGTDGRVAGRAARAIFERWSGVDGLEQQLIQALIHLGSVGLAERMLAIAEEKMGKRISPALLGLKLILVIKKGCKDSGYDLMGQILREYREKRVGLHPGLARWAHQGFLELTDGQEQLVHRLCSELVGDQPLSAWEDLEGA